jgi:hypothetical protein
MYSPSTSQPTLRVLKGFRMTRREVSIGGMSGDSLPTPTPFK